MRIRSYLPVICFLCLKYFMYNLMSSLEEVQTNSTLFSKLYSKKNKQTKTDGKQTDKTVEPLIDNVNKEPDSIDNSSNEDSLVMGANNDAKVASDEANATVDATSSELETKDQNQSDDKQIDFDHSNHHYSFDNPSSI